MTASTAAPVAQASEILSIPLSKLRAGEHNVRVVSDPASAAADAELVASIRGHGLLENLVVTPRTKTLYGVTAGGRRLRALQALADEGAIPKNHPIPCLVVDADAATECSLAENVVRIAMHPADQVAAFAKVAAEGATVEQIASRFGVTRRTVERRLRLGGLAPEILEAYRTGRINQDTAEAFAMTSNQDFQAGLFKTLSDRNAVYAHAVRHALSERNERSDCPLAMFVGLKAYRDAGGRLEETLFDDHSHVLDPDLLHRLADEKLGQEADRYRADWAWVELKDQFTWLDQQDYRVIEPVNRTSFTDTESTTLNDSESRIEELSERLDDPALTAGDRQSLWVELATYQRNYSITELARADRDEYSPLAHSHAGIVLSVDEEGHLTVTRGLLRRDDCAAYDQAVALASDDPEAPAARGDTPVNGSNGAAHVPSPGNDNAGAEDDSPALSDTLRRDLRIMRGAAIRQALAHSPTVAVDFLTFHIARALAGFHVPVSHGGRYVPNPLAFRAEYTGNHASDQLKTSNVMNHLDPSPAGDIDLGWIADDDRERAFATFRALSDADRASVLAHAVARLTVHFLDDDDDQPGEYREMVRALDLDFPAELAAIGAAPFTGDLVFGRMTKALLLDAGAAAFGDEWRDRHATAKKGDLVTAAERDFGSDPSRDPDVEARAREWLPAGFRVAERTAGDAGTTPEADAPATARDATPAPDSNGEIPQTAREFVDKVRSDGHAAIVIDPNDPESIPDFLRN